jgi:predicted transglutaminase-like cysteine proteinase
MPPKTASVPETALPRQGAKTPLKTADVEKAQPPQGWAEFCARYAAECDVKPAAPRDIVLTADRWNAIVGVNQWVNEHVKPATDRELWGAPNKWHYPDRGRGDCKSYVLLKRRMLIEAGFPHQALLITIVWTKQDTGHAVLIIRTDKGDFVLDNLSSEVSLAYDTGYNFVKRQSQSDPNAWVYIDGDPWKQPLTATPLRAPDVQYL